MESSRRRGRGTGYSIRLIYWLPAAFTSAVTRCTQHPALSAGHAFLLYSLREHESSNYSRNCHYRLFNRRTYHASNYKYDKLPTTVITLSTITLQIISGGLHSVLTFTGVKRKWLNFQQYKLWTSTIWVSS